MGTRRNKEENQLPVVPSCSYPPQKPANALNREVRHTSSLMPDPPRGEADLRALSERFSEAEHASDRERLGEKRRVDRAWAAAGLVRSTSHQCRHTYGSLMIAAGVNAKALSTYGGHANTWITLDRAPHGCLAVGWRLHRAAFKVLRAGADIRSRGSDTVGPDST